jgi:hypothetical protein
LRKFLHRFELRIAAMAAIALLLAQLGAMSHAYSHDMTAAHQSGASSHEPCNDCLGYAPVLLGAAAPGTLPRVEAQSHARTVQAASRSRVDRTLHLAFRSRAPPKTPLVF